MIRVLFFASLREAVGYSRCEFALPSSTEPDIGLESLMVELRSRLGADAYAALEAENIRIAVNQELVNSVVTLKAGDEVAFLPPVTGG